MYLHSHHKSLLNAYDALENMYADGSVSPCEVAVVRALTKRERGVMGWDETKTRVGIFLKDYEE